MATRLRGADLLVRSLEVAEVSHVFALSGNHIMSLFDACVDTGIEIVHVRHEAAAVHMADAVGRLTGRPGVALATGGPGHANCLSAMYVALAAESPLVLISGHAASDQVGRGAFQELAQAEMAGHVAKASWTASDSASLGLEIARAMRLAVSGRPGPVHLSVPVDVLEAPVESLRDSVPQADDFFGSVSLLDDASAQTVLDELLQARCPLILTGPATARGATGERLREFESVTNIPVIPVRSPRGLDDPRLGRCRQLMASVDTICLIGKKLDFTLGFGSSLPPDARLLQIDADMTVVEANCNASIGHVQSVLAEPADPLLAVDRLLLATQDRTPRTDAWLAEVRDVLAERVDVAATADDCLHAAEVATAVSNWLGQSDESVLISDGGEFGQWMQAGATADEVLINGPSGAIGGAIPFALAASICRPDSRIVTAMGDGTFGFHASEFDTAVRYEMPFIAVVGNDACWNAEHQIQRRKYGDERAVGCELNPTDYGAVATALGGYGESVRTVGELTAALDHALQSGKPACVNVAIAREPAPRFD